MKTDMNENNLPALSELLPCPFCNCEAEFQRQGTRNQSCIVVCTSCGCLHESGDSFARSGTSWNRRALAATPPGAEPYGWVCPAEEMNVQTGTVLKRCDVFVTDISERDRLQEQYGLQFIPLYALPPAYRGGEGDADA